MFKHRMIYGLLLIAALVVVFYLDSQTGSGGLLEQPLHRVLGDHHQLPQGIVLFIALLFLLGPGARELTTIFRAKGVEVSNGMVVPAAGLGLGLSYLWGLRLGTQDSAPLVITGMALVFLGSLLWHSRKKQAKGAIAVAGACLFAMAYLGLLPGFLMAIRVEHGSWITVGVLLIIKSGDIGAYLVGRAIGRHKLILWLSPGKTWEGLAGGVAVTAVVAGGLAAWFNHAQGVGGANEAAPGAARLPVGWVAGGAVLVALAGLVGDLLESLLKRDADLKDSGRFVPGLGGALDLYDSPIVAIPVAYWLLRCLG